MRHIVLLVAVAVVMAAMMLGMALPALAAGPETGECARSIAQGETEIKGNKGEAIRSLCVLTKGL